MLKRASVAHCPWDLARYGGDQPYLRLFDALPLGVPAGHCLPAGHASSALWLVALCVYWLPSRPGAARNVAALALLLGGLVGWMQQLRGAHFLTHTLWSTWIACAVVLAIVAGLQRLTLRREAAAHDYLAEQLEDAG
jgi:membrane-associated PAP2 superfamily phosphatase